MMTIKKSIKMLLILLPLLLLGGASGYLGMRTYTLTSTLTRVSKDQKANLQKYDKETAELKGSYAKIEVELGHLQSDYARLQKDHSDLTAERDKLAAEKKELVLAKEHAQELDASFESVSKEKEKLEITNKELLDKTLALKDQVKDLDALQKQLIKEKEQLQDNYDRISSKTGVKMIEQGLADAQKKNVQLQEEWKQKDNELKAAKESEGKAKEEAAQLSKKLEEINKNFAEAVDKNKHFEQKVLDDPTRFAELARQNKILIKQTANMHYNLGVFYSSRKEYSRSIAEFEKAVELVPDDASALFNLGYIYSEQVVNREKAIRYFQQYLRYAKKDDKDIDWVKKYIVTWDAYEGKQPTD